MNTFSKFLFSAALAIGLFGCGGFASIKSTEKIAGYDKKVTSVLVLIDTSHLTKAFTGSETTLIPSQKNGEEANPRALFSRSEDRPQHLSNAIKGLNESFTAGLKAVNVDVVTEAVSVAIDASSIVKAVRKYQRKQILILSTDSFQTSQQTRYGVPISAPGWNGKVSWSLSLYDTDKVANPEGKAVWTAKTDFFSLGVPDCGMDAYKTCTNRFANAVIEQMRGEGLIAKN